MVVSLRAEVRRLRKEVEEARSVREEVQEAGNFDKYKGKPVEFIREVLEFEPTEDQIAIIESVWKNKETNVPAGHGVGKTAVSAQIALAFIFLEQGMVISTAPTKRQVNELLWGEIRKAYDRHKHKLGGERGQTFIRLTEQARGYGCTSRDYDSQGFQGIHSDKLLIIEDEANGISQEVDDAVQSCVTGASNRILRLGNPTVGGTPFEKSCNITKLPIPVWNHPNVSWAYEIAIEDSGVRSKGEYYLKPEVAADILDDDGNVKPVSEWSEHYRRLGNNVPGAVSVEWIEDKRKRKGESSAFWVGRVHARFPQDNAQSIVPRSWFEAARAKYDKDPDYWQRAARQAPYYRIGVDVGDGIDNTAISVWRGNVLLEVRLIHTKGDRQDTERSITAAWEAVKQYPGIIGVDRIGVGAGVLSGLLTRLQSEEAKREFWANPVKPSATGVNFGGKSELQVAETETLNCKADLYWSVREALRKDEIAIAPLDPEIEEMLADEFALTYYEETPQGKTKLEPKTMTRNRLGRSPDCADAVVIGYGVKAIQTTVDTRNFLSVMS